MDKKIYCKQCGKPGSSDRNFCTSCGAPLGMNFPTEAAPHQHTAKKPGIRLNSKKTLIIPLIITLVILSGCGGLFKAKQNIKKPLPSRVHVIKHDLSEGITEWEQQRTYDKDGVVKAIVITTDDNKTKWNITRKKNNGNYELTGKIKTVK